jgi:hypothetical protein
MGRRTELPRHRVKWMSMLPHPLALCLLNTHQAHLQSSRHIHHHTLARMGRMYLSMFTAFVLLFYYYSFRVL